MSAKFHPKLAYASQIAIERTFKSIFETKDLPKEKNLELMLSLKAHMNMVNDFCKGEREVAEAEDNRLYKYDIWRNLLEKI